MSRMIFGYIRTARSRATFRNRCLPAAAAIATLLLWLVFAVHAQVPRKIAYQGYFTDAASLYVVKCSNARCAGP